MECPKCGQTVEKLFYSGRFDENRKMEFICGDCRSDEMREAREKDEQIL